MQKYRITMLLLELVWLTLLVPVIVADAWLGDRRWKRLPDEKRPS